MHVGAEEPDSSLQLRGFLLAHVATLWVRGRRDVLSLPDRKQGTFVRDNQHLSLDTDFRFLASVCAHVVRST